MCQVSIYLYYNKIKPDLCKSPKITEKTALVLLTFNHSKKNKLCSVYRFKLGSKNLIPYTVLEAKNKLMYRYTQNQHIYFGMAHFVSSFYAFLMIASPSKEVRQNFSFYSYVKHRQYKVYTSEPFLKPSPINA